MLEIPVEKTFGISLNIDSDEKESSRNVDFKFSSFVLRSCRAIKYKREMVYVPMCEFIPKKIHQRTYGPVVFLLGLGLM